MYGYVSMRGLGIDVCLEMIIISFAIAINLYSTQLDLLNQQYIQRLVCVTAFKTNIIR